MSDSDVTREANNAARSMRGDRARGELQFRQLLQRVPDDGMVYFQRAKVLEELGALDESAADYDRAAELLKYPSWIQKATHGAARVRRAQVARPINSARPSGGRPSISAQEFEMAAQVFRAREPRAVV